MSVHHHSHQHRTGRVLNWSVAATILFVIVELTAGLRAGSLALISDAGHNFTDALSLVLAAIGLYLESRPADSVSLRLSTRRRPDRLHQRSNAGGNLDLHLL